MHSRIYKGEVTFEITPLNISGRLMSLAPRRKQYYGCHCRSRWDGMVVISITIEQSILGRIFTSSIPTPDWYIEWIPIVTRVSARFDKIAPFMDYMLFILYRDTFGPVFVFMLTSKQSLLKLLNVDLFRLLKSHFY